MSRPHRVSSAGVLVLLVIGVPQALAQGTLSKTAADLKQNADATVAAVDKYFKAAPGNPAGDPDREGQVRSFREFARELHDGMAMVAEAAALPLAASSAAAFMERFDAPRVSDPDLIDLASRSRLDRFIPLTDDAPHCCDKLTADLAPAEHALAVTLGAIWKGFGPGALDASIKKLTAVYGQFEAKLLKGFPGMPWEYILNFQGTRDGPSRSQLIWVHPSMGFEVDDRASEGTSQARAVLAIQAIGYNYYFFKGLNYIGAAALLTMNATEGRDRWRKGGAVHLGNVASIGATYGDQRWVWFVSSDRLGDKLVGALVKLR